MAVRPARVPLSTTQADMSAAAIANNGQFRVICQLE
jgi:hypothetical protein